MNTNNYSLTRRRFVGAFSAMCADRLIASSKKLQSTDERIAIQKEIDAIQPEDYTAYVKRGASISAKECEAAYRRWPILKRYDDAFRHIVKRMRETKVTTDLPAVWYVYNMGIIVKTRETVFSIDLCHRLAPTIADELDFAIITHNHDDHFTQEFYNAMDSRHKTVISNFADNYGACFHKVQGGFSRGECTYQIKDVTVNTHQTDHNTFLKGFVMPAEVSTKSYTILNSGDTYNTEDIHPKHTPDMWIHHPFCWREKNGLSETVRGIRAFHPRLVVLAHHQELAHPIGGSRWTFRQVERRKLQAEGVKAIIPFWGDQLT